MRDEFNSGFQPPQTLLDAVPAFSPALSSSTRSTRRKRGVAGRRSETNSGAGALFHPARAAGPATPNYHVVSVRCANSVSKVFSTGPKFAILLFLEHKSKKQGYGRNPRLLPARQRTVATRASRRRAAWREIVFAASHQRRSGLLGHVVSGDARDEVRKDGRGPSRRRDCLNNLSQSIENIDFAPGIATLPRGYPGGWVRLVRHIGAGEAHDEAGKDGRGPPGRCGRPENLSQSLENIDSAPGFSSLPGSYPGGRVRLLRHVGAGDAHDEAREDSRGPPGRRPRPENQSQSLENIDSAPGFSTLPWSYPGGRVRLVRHIGAGEAHDEAGKHGRGPRGRCGRPENLVANP